MITSTILSMILLTESINFFTGLVCLLGIKSMQTLKKMVTKMTCNILALLVNALNIFCGTSSKKKLNGPLSQTSADAILSLMLDVKPSDRLIKASGFTLEPGENTLTKNKPKTTAKTVVNK